MHLYATGAGTDPTVVLEAGTRAFSIDWHLVKQEVARFVKVCSYDRAGHAWSELGPRPPTMKLKGGHQCRIHSQPPGLHRDVAVGHTDAVAKRFALRKFFLCFSNCPRQAKNGS